MSLYGARTQPRYGAAPLRLEMIEPPKQVATEGGRRVLDVPLNFRKISAGYNDHEFHEPKFSATAEVADQYRQLEIRDVIIRLARELESDPSSKRPIKELMKFTPLDVSSPGGFVATGWDTHPQCRPFPREVLDHAAEILQGDKDEAQPNYSYPIHSNSGYPLFVGGLESKLWSMAVGRELRTEDDLGRISDFITGVVPGDFGDVVPVVQWRRVQQGSATKKTHVFEFGADGRLWHAADLYGTARCRPVFGLSTWINYPELRGSLLVMKRYKESLPFTFRHKTGQYNCLKLRDALATLPKGTRVVADDVSGYDMSVSPVIQRQLYKVFDRVLPGAFFLSEYKLKMPIIGSALYLGDAAFLYPHQGGIMSGDQKTSCEGTLINYLTVVSALSALFKKTVPELLAGMYGYPTCTHPWWGVLISGDDTLLLVPEDFDVEAYAACCLEYGQTRTPEEHVKFLGYYMEPQEGLAYTGAARVLTMRFSSERRHAGPATELFGALDAWRTCVQDPYFERMLLTYHSRSLLCKRYELSVSDLMDAGVYERFRGLATEEIKQSPQSSEHAERLARDMAGRFSASYGDILAFSDDAGLLQPARDTQAKLASMATRPLDWRAYLEEHFAKERI